MTLVAALSDVAAPTGVAPSPRACATVEYPTLRQVGVGGGCLDEPAQDVILLNDILPESPLLGKGSDLPNRDHDGPSSVMWALTRRPHSLTRSPAGEPVGSSSEMPDESRRLQSATKGALPRCMVTTR